MSTDPPPLESVPFLDLTGPYLELREELDEAFSRFMTSGWFVLGTEVSAFEDEYAAYCEALHCVGVANGLDALRLALHSCDVGPGDEVIVPSNTYIATWLAVTQCGAVVVPVEPDPATFNIDVDRIAAAFTARTKVVLPVNLYGHPCDYDPILRAAHARGLKVVVDNAQAHGARYRGRRVGGIADVECHSFYPTKNLGAYGDAGAVTTNDPAIADRLRVLRNYGSRVRYENEELGFNSRLDELQAAFLRIKLRKLDEWNERRRRVATEYLRGLVDTGLTLPTVADWAEHVWHLFVVRHDERDILRADLTSAGIETLLHYPTPPHLSQAYEANGFEAGSFPIAEQLALEVVSLPLAPTTTEQSVERTIQAVRGFGGER